MRQNLEFMLDPDHDKKVSNAIVVVPDLVERSVHYFVDVGEGQFERCAPKQTLYSYDNRGETNKINNLVGKKVIFIPIKTEPEMKAYLARKSEIEPVPLGEIYVFGMEEDNFGKVISTIKAEVYNPFTKMDANRVSKFVSKYIPNLKCTR